ncbi:hypothetical protein P3X46_032437 [Hevea brasiliensis]|uniref:RNase H type-1 domain-containing protein n=1 Tax=Hevea brasiliensis TaxID=3981 RepID=A0ABQ9KGB9_HEVBR|nr:hypothetical protein P3X46_032437 [Hevea brasiliensis]
MTSLQVWFNNLFSSDHETSIEEAFMIMWSLWSHRNEVVWHQKYQQPFSILSRARSIHSEWNVACVNISPHTAHVHPDSVLQTHWKPLEQGAFKCNIDVALLNDGSYGLGTIIRDYTGYCCVGRLLARLGLIVPLIGEVLSFREALSWLKSLSFQPVCVETDSQLVFQVLNTSYAFSSYFAMIINDCKILFQELQFISYAFVRKQKRIKLPIRLLERLILCLVVNGTYASLSFLYDSLSFNLNNMS